MSKETGSQSHSNPSELRGKEKNRAKVKRGKEKKKVSIKQAPPAPHKNKKEKGQA